MLQGGDAKYLTIRSTLTIMVTPITFRKDTPDYSLNRIHELAKAGQVEYVGTCERDVGNLSYDLDEVCRCLQCLTKANFDHSERYDEKKSWRDVYLTQYRGPAECIDDLYIKLRLDHDCTVIYLHSFHQPRTL
jgi:hypothetical protein